MRICWHIDEAVDVIAAMPVASALPLRTILVGNPHLARELRRLLLSTGRTHILAGTRFIAPAVLAEATLRRAGAVFQPGEEELREHRIAQLISVGLDPPGFDRGLLTETVGWSAAFAATISELEFADLRPEDLSVNDARVHGLRIVWQAAHDSAGVSWTRARMLGEAARRLDADPALIRSDDHVLVLLASDAAAAVARFASAIQDATVVAFGTRPRRRGAIPVAATLVVDRDATVTPSDLAIVAQYAFENDADIEPSDRRRAGASPDGTLTLEEYDGVSAEVEAAIDWVARRVLEGTALDRIAVLTPLADPWCSLVAAGLRALGGSEGRVAVEIPEGVPLIHEAAGARVHTLLNALRERLGVDALVDVLCCVRAGDGTSSKPSRSRVVDFVYSLGTRGGSAAHPERALEWRERIARAEERLSMPVDTEGFADQAEHVARRQEVRLATLRALRPATHALCDLAEALATGAALPQVTAGLVAFIGTHLIQPGEGPRIHALLEQRTAPICADATCREIRGVAALELLGSVLSRTRVSPETSTLAARTAAVYVGTVAGAAGLTFDAVRVIGMCEGSIPPTVRGDPVLPDELRAMVSPRLVTAADRVADALGHLDLVIRGTRQRLSISAPRLAADRTLREPSSIFIEIGAALARQGAEPGHAPDLDELRRTDMRPAYAAAERERSLRPCRPSDWLDRLASNTREVPPTWRDRPAHDLFRMRADVPTASAWHPMDGILDAGAATDSDAALPGLAAARPISAWMIQTLLECPHRFLYEHVMRWEEPQAPPPGHDLDPMSFGHLLHAVAERFFRTHGAPFGRQEHTLAYWRDVVRRIAADELARELESHGLDSPDAADAVGRKLRTHVDRLVEHTWSRGSRRFFAAEWAFGFETPLRLDMPGGELFLRGRIDLIDLDEEETRVHDFKTGKCTPRRGHDSEASPGTDLQVGLYAAVVSQLAAELRLPRRVGGSYIHTNDRRGSERSFVGTDADDLRVAALEWLECARELLRARVFPRTPHHADCDWCRFKPVCSDSARLRSDGLLASAAEPALVHFRRLKGAQ